MAAAIVAIFLGGIVVITEVILSMLGIAMFIAPYAGGALISVAVCEEVPGAKNLVPGHAVLNYLLVVCKINNYTYISHYVILNTPKFTEVFRDGKINTISAFRRRS